MEYLNRYAWTHYTYDASSPSTNTGYKSIGGTVPAGRWIILAASAFGRWAHTTSYFITLSNSTTGEFTTFYPEMLTSLTHSYTVTNTAFYGYLVIQAPHDFDRVASRYSYKSSDFHSSFALYEMDKEPEILGTYYESDEIFDADLKAGDHVIAITEDNSTTGRNMTELARSSIGMGIYEYEVTADGSYSLSPGSTTRPTYFIVTRVKPQQTHVLENGLGVPVSLEGEAFFSPANDPTPSYDSPLMLDTLNGTSSAFDINVPVTTLEGAVFAGTKNDHIEYTLSMGTNPDCTYTVWFKTDGEFPDSGGAALYRHHDTTTWNGTATHNRLFFVNGGWQINGSVVTVSAPTAYLDGNWHHAAVTRSGTTSKLYFDGVLAGTATTASTYAATHGLLLGTAYPGTDKFNNTTVGFPFKGNLDDFAVFNRVLNDTEIANIHMAGRSVPQGWYAVRPVTIEGTFNATTQTVEPF